MLGVDICHPHMKQHKLIAFLFCFALSCSTQARDESVTVAHSRLASLKNSFRIWSIANAEAIQSEKLLRAVSFSIVADLLSVHETGIDLSSVKPYRLEVICELHLSDTEKLFGYLHNPLIAEAAKTYLDEIVPVADSKISRIRNGRIENGCEALTNASGV